MNEVGGEPKQPFEVIPPAEAAESAKTPLEQPAPAQEAVAGKQATPASLQLPTTIPDTPVAIPVQDGDAKSSSVASPKTSGLPAADKNLIEKQWVQKAKEIVAETRSDPYKQKSQMSKAKADYIQKRFKKIVKTDDPFDVTQGRPEQGRTGDAVTA